MDGRYLQDVESTLPVAANVQTTPRDGFGTAGWMGAKRQQAFLRRWGPRLLSLSFLQDGIHMLLHAPMFARMLTRRTEIVSAGTPIIVTIALGQLVGAFFLMTGGVTMVRAACCALAALTMLRPWAFFVAGRQLVHPFATTGSLVLLAALCDPRQRVASKGIVGANDSKLLHALHLVGRVLITLLFFHEALMSQDGGLHGLMETPSLSRLVVFVALLGGSLMVCVGFHTRASALALSALIATFAAWMYPFWWCPPRVRYPFFHLFCQSLSTVGGLFLLASNGPGRLSVEAALRKDV